MRDLSFCERPFEDGAQPIPSHDPRFLHIADLAQRSKYAEAADAIEALHQENLFDARLWGYYLYRAFEEDGCARMPELFDAISAITTRDWREVLPKAKAPAYLNRTISWLFQTLLAALEYHQTNKDKDPTWKKWLTGVDQERLGLAIERAEALLKSLPEPAYHQSIELLSRMLRWLRQLHGELTPKPTAAKTDERSQTMSAANEAPSAPEPGPAHGQTLQLRGSPKLWELLAKLKAFETLVDKRAFQRAALVSDDIIVAIESFDPRDYFPELFARFGALFHAHVKEISPHWSAKDSVEWKALAQFYHVDLDGFVKD